MTERTPTEPRTSDGGPLDIASFGVVLLAMLYVTGFIVVFAHNERLGLLTVPSDFFQLRYLHVGVLASAFIGICTSIPFLIALSLPTRKTTPWPDKLARLAQLAMVALMTIGIYTLLALARPRSFSQGALTALALYSALATFHLWRMQWRERKTAEASTNSSPGYDQTLCGWVVRLVLVFLAVAFFVFQLQSVPQPAGHWWMRLIALVALCFLMGAALGRLVYARPPDSTERGRWIRRVAPFVLLLAFLYYFIVYGFSIVIYSLVPLTKGGGNFADAAAVSLRLTAEAAQGLSDSAKEAFDQPVVVVLETSEYLYVAPDPGQSERAKWGIESPVEFYVVPRQSITLIAPTHRAGSKDDGVHAPQIGQRRAEDPT